MTPFDFHGSIPVEYYLHMIGHIPEWQSNYSPLRFGMGSLDGIDWILEFSYYGKHNNLEFARGNDYPYNFKKFIELLGLDAYFDIAL